MRFLLKSNRFELLGLSIALLCLGGCAGPSAGSSIAKEREERAGRAVTLAADEKSALLALAYDTFDHHFGLSDTPTVHDEALEAAVSSYSTVFVTIYHPKGRLLGCQGSSSKRGQPQGLAEDVRTAVYRAIGDKRFVQGLSKEELGATRLVINIFHSPRAAKGRTPETLSREIEPGIHAIAVRRGTRRALFKETVPITSNYSLKRTLERLSEKAKLGKNGYRKGDARITVYETVTFTGDRQGRLVELYRYNVLVRPEALTQQLLEERLQLAASWFQHNMNEETGLLKYQYNPARDRYSSNDNHIRRMASAWAMAKLANRFEDERLRAASAGMVEHYLGSTIPHEQGGRYLTVDGRSPIAFGAFLILALSELPDYPQRDGLIRQLAQGIVNQQQPDGSFRTMVGATDILRGIDFYPGEAMLALMRAYELLREAAYLESVERAFPFYRDYWRRNRNTAFVPWHSQVNLLLYQATQDPEVAAFTFELNDWIIDEYQIITPDHLDELGGFAVGSSGNPRNSTSSYMEGIGAAYHLAMLIGDQPHMEKYGASIRLGVRFVLQTQYTPENAFYLKNPARAIGGFTQSLTRTFQRNDYTQHAVMALLNASATQLFPKAQE